MTRPIYITRGISQDFLSGRATRVLNVLDELPSREHDRVVRIHTNPFETDTETVLVESRMKKFKKFKAKQKYHLKRSNNNKMKKRRMFTRANNVFLFVVRGFVICHKSPVNSRVRGTRI